MGGLVCFFNFISFERPNNFFKVFAILIKLITFLYFHKGTVWPFFLKETYVYLENC